jgi:predicted  nucleic acid-binding Zn-ribbon protein
MNLFNWLNIFSRVTKLEKRQMATEQELNQGLQELQAAIVEKDTELKARFAALETTIAELKAQVDANPGINLDDEFLAVQGATQAVRNLLAQPVTPPIEPPPVA